ncbi:MAG: NAD-dependent epimerase/dehydratase family protein, partial [Myxococcota bacterium]
MKVLVTGSNGFLGAATVRRLLERGFVRPRCLLRAGSDRSRLDAIIETYGPGSIDIQVGTLATVEGCRALLEDVDLVFHVAAQLSGSAADLFLGTVVASEKLVEAL